VPPSTRWRRAEAAAAEPGAARADVATTWSVDPRGGIDHVLPLSNGATSTLLRAAGGGGAHWGGVILTRDQPHDTGGARGTTIYLRDLDDGDLWTTTLDPIGGDPADCEVTFGRTRSATGAGAAAWWPATRSSSPTATRWSCGA
jgi:cyclic beta-1,2-glucan synthetase